MARIGTTRRVVFATVAAGSALALTACGSDGVMTSGGTAATHGPTTVTTTQVQDAVSDINQSDPQGQITGQQAAIFLALEPELTKLARRYGATTTADEVQQEFASQVPDRLNPSAVRVIRASAQLNKLTTGSNKSASAAVRKLLTTADVHLNPRYGEFSKGAVRKASTNWIDPSSSSASDEGTGQQ